MTHQRPEFRELQGYLPTLDGWRAVAICFVFLAHGSESIAAAFGIPFDRLGQLPQLGTYGVDLFFAISGLLITSRLLADESVSGFIHLKSFYIRRAFRILPPSLTYLAIIALLGAAGAIAFRSDYWFGALFFYINYQPTVPQPVGVLWSHAAEQHFQAFWYVGHFWSLAVEEHFYAFWPALLVVLKPRRRMIAALAMIAAIVVWRALNIKFASVFTPLLGDFFLNQTRTDFRLDGILWGALAALAFNHFTGANPRTWLERLLTLRVGLPVFGIVLLTVFLPAGWKTAQLLLLFRRMADPLILLIAILNCRGLVASVLENRVVRSIGKLSYSLYLWQQLFLAPTSQSGSAMPWAQRFPQNLACAFACAFASYWLLEKPLIRIGHRLAKRFDGTHPAPASTPGSMTAPHHPHLEPNRLATR